ncbi:hypothetical protein DFH06DRAFT_1140041 [Mycena polygramma]|nr:hypothetical protein DFH06DRAFT_1140041 [Mycena polygramma]
MSNPLRSARRRRARAAPAAAAASSSSSVSVASLSFSPDDLMPHPAADRPINTFVDRASSDLRRVYRDVVPVEPPSPVKKARLATTNEGRTPMAPLTDLWEGLDQEGDRYDMFSQGLDEDGPFPAPPRKAGSGRKIFSDPTLYEWKENGRDLYTRELLRLDGCGDASEDLCPGCESAAPTRRPIYRCQDCHGGLLYCEECCVRRHAENPLHNIDKWTGARFVKTPLKDLGLVVQFGHPPGKTCGNPQPGHMHFVTLHDNGIHEVAVRYCGCEHRARAGSPEVQLLRRGWLPGSTKQPRTCMTLRGLEKFHIATLQAKTTMYDYYKSLERLTRHDGVKPPDRYQVFIRICKKYRHVMMLKRRGQGHDPGGAAATKPGSLAIRCIACPRPGVNTPEDWENLPPEERFIYTLFLALDACFRLKRGLVSSELKDPGLGTGMSYMLENPPYREFLRGVTDQKEMSTCSGLAALDYANTKFSRGYSSTGVGMCVCARHEFIQPNGVGDLQKGERFANMDYITGSVLRHHDPLLILMISYDIVCQWWKTVIERLQALPELVRCVLILSMVAFVIPKMHIHAHILACQIVYSLNLKPGSGQTDGEGIERPWSNIGGIASATRIMGPGARHDTIDDHWMYWNWEKLLSLAETLRRRLDVALEQQIVQREALDAFSEQQQERVDAWKQMVHAYEADSTNKNPYEAVVEGLTEQQVRLQFQREEEEEAKRGAPLKHKVSPATFVVECLEVEEEQRRVRVQGELKKAQTTSQQIDMTTIRTKLIRRLERLRKLQGTYSPASILALESREAPADELPENEPLFLPSALSDAARVAGCTPGLLEMELLLRDAQCRASLVRLRNQLHIKARYLNYKKLHARHQGANTRSRSIVHRNESKIRLHSEKYQAAWSALVACAGGDESRVGWTKLRKEDIRCMEDAEDLKKKEQKRRRALERQRRKYQELLSHGEEPQPMEEGEDDEEVDDGEDGERARESRREVSWIWTAAGSSGTDAGLEDALRIEWAKAYARSRRWDEEVKHLRAEFGRCPLGLEFEAELWEKRGKDVPVGVIDDVLAQGMIAYACKQSDLYRDLASRARTTETAPKAVRGKRQPQVRTMDPLSMPVDDGGLMDDDSENEDNDCVDAERDNEEEPGERPGLESDDDEELVMGGEVDEW